MSNSCDRNRPAPRKSGEDLEVTNCDVQSGRQNGLAPALLRLVQDRDDGVRGLLQLAIANPACCVECDSGIGGEKPIGPDATRPIQTTRLEIGRVKHDGVLVGFGLAGNLAKYDVVAAQGRKNQCGTPLRLGQAGEWKMQDYDVPSYKSAQAASSSGESQTRRRV